MTSVLWYSMANAPARLTKIRDRENEDPESIVGDQAPKEPEYTEVCGA